MSLVYHGSILLYSAVVLCSLNAVTKESTTMTRRFRRSTPHPRLGPAVQLSCGDAGSSLNFFGGSLGLTS